MPDPFDKLDSLGGQVEASIGDIFSKLDSLGKSRTRTPAPERTTFEKILRGMATGERFVAGGAQATNKLLPNQKNPPKMGTSLLDVPIAALNQVGSTIAGAITHPKEFVRGGVAAAKGDMDTQKLMQGTRPDLPPGQRAAAAFIAGGLSDPFTYIPLEKPLALIGQGAKLIPGVAKVTEAVGRTRPMQAISRMLAARKTLGQVEQKARLASGAEDLDVAELAAKIEHLDKVGIPAVTTTQRKIEEAMTGVYQGARDAAGAQARAASKAARVKQAQAKKLAVEADALYKKASKASAPVQAERLRVARGAVKQGESAVGKAQATEAAITRTERNLDRLKMKAQNAEIVASEARQTEAGKYAAAAFKKKQAAVQAATDAELALQEAQSLGLKKAQALGKKAPTDRALKGVYRLAEQGAIPEAHAAAKGAMDATLEQIARQAGQAHADEIRKTLGELQAITQRMGQAAVDSGRLTPEALEKWGKYYLWRGFEKTQFTDDYIKRLRDVEPELASMLEQQRRYGDAAQGIAGSARKGRDLLTPQGMQNLGELSAAQRLIIGSRKSQTATAQATRLQGFSQAFSKTRQDFLSMGDRARRKWMLVNEKTNPLGGRWGELHGRAIPRWLAAHLGILGEGAGWEARLASWALPAQRGELTGGAWRVWNGLLGQWKRIHTVLNLPTDSRNVMGNAMLTYLAGKVPAAQIPEYTAKGLRAIVMRTPELRQAIRLNPGMRATFKESELGILRRAMQAGEQNTSSLLNRVIRGFKSAEARFDSLYDLAEQTSKMSVYLYHTERGMPAEKAAELAVKAIFDYGDVTRATNFIRRSGIAPFITYPVKAAQTLGPALLTDTGRFATLEKAIKAPGYAMSPEQIPSEQAAMPDYMKGTYARLPLRDKQGNTLYLNIGFTLPFGPWQQNIIGMGAGDLAPIVNLVQDYIHNQSSFTGRPIWDENWPEEDIRDAKLAYFAEHIPPPFIVSGYKEVKAALQGRKKAVSMGEAEAPSLGRALLANVAGLRTKALQPERELKIEAVKAKAIQITMMKKAREIARKRAAGEITDAEAQERLNRLRTHGKGKIEEYQGKRQRYEEAKP